MGWAMFHTMVASDGPKAPTLKHTYDHLIITNGPKAPRPQAALGGHFDTDVGHEPIYPRRYQNGRLRRYQNDHLAYS